MTVDARQRGEVIRARRKERGLTQKELARLTKVGESTIRNLEAGAYQRPQAGVLAAVGAALDLDLEAMGTDRAELVRNTMLAGDVRTALDVLGGWLMAMPDDRRQAALSAMYRWMLSGEGPGSVAESTESVT